MAPKPASMPNALRKIRAIISGTCSALSTRITNATSMYARAMNGTTNSAKRAMRLTPPKMMKPSARTTPVAVTVGAMPQALPRPAAMPLACTPGRKKPVATMVTIANSHAYHFCPIAFSM